MKDYKKLNTIIGLIVGLAACTVFIMTAESTASFWDCGEFISTGFKLEVGHPPGAPTFNLLSRIVSLFSFGNIAMVPRLVNYLSAVCSGLAVMFTFWIITYMARKFFVKTKEDAMSRADMFAVLGAGIVGAMAFTFCDSFWFSAVEGEVYAMAAFFTAIIFWCATKWEREPEAKNRFRWIILIGYLIGLSIGVHLLNLLAIPAIGFIYYFKTYKKPNWKGIILTALISVGVTGFILNILIPQIVNLFAHTELLFVNSIGLPFNSGSLFFIFILVGIIVTGILYTIRENPSSLLKAMLAIISVIFIILIFNSSDSFGGFFLRLIFVSLLVFAAYSLRNKKAVINTAILCLTFLLIGYSTYIILVIRSNANTPLNENSPKNAIALLAYLAREQYGDWPLLYGQYYNAPQDPKDPYSDGNPVYSRDDKKGKYIITDQKKGIKPNYDPRFCTIFPRMWKSEKAEDYKKWANIKGTPITVEGREGTKTINKPTFGENLYYFFRYQLGYMYWRYFLWNFVGRQNDQEGGLGEAENGVFGDPLYGNWISGIESVDKSLVGPIDLLPDNMKNKAENHFYFLPLILGLIGLFYQFKKNYGDGLVVLLFFIMTGLAITLYLNQGPNEPRERDYAYAGSMMAFCMWIGFGVVALYDLAKKYIKPIVAVFLVTILCFAAVPFVMGKEGWNDHDRSGRYTMVDFASNYLNSCEKNAILFTNGDNDTFPLWYAQEVEGIRTDVRVVNLSLLNTDWYIDAMKRKAYDSDALPISMTWDQYKSGTRDAVYFISDTTVCKSNQHYELKDLLNFALSDDPAAKYTIQSGKMLDYIPTKKFKLTVDKQAALATGTVPKELADSIVDKMEWTMTDNAIEKNNLAVLDIIAHNNWKRPIYFSITTGNDAYINLEDYFQLEGLAYRLVPIKVRKEAVRLAGMQITGRVYSKAMFDHLMNKFKWGNMKDSTVYLDETNLRMTMNMRNNFVRLANALEAEGKKDSAVKVLDRCMEVMPESSVPYDYFVLLIAESYYNAGATAKANKIMARLITLFEQDIVYFRAFSGDMAKEIESKKSQALRIMGATGYVAELYKQDSLSKKANAIYEKYSGTNESAAPQKTIRKSKLK